MNKAKLWLAQIALVAIVGLVFGSPALAGVDNGNASDNGIANASKKAKGEGGESTRGHVGSHSSGGGQGGGQPQSDTTSTGDNTGTSEPVCISGDTAGCTENTCNSAGGFWGTDGVCYIF